MRNSTISATVAAVVLGGVADPALGDRVASTVSRLGSACSSATQPGPPQVVTLVEPLPRSSRIVGLAAFEALDRSAYGSGGVPWPAGSGSFSVGPTAPTREAGEWVLAVTHTESYYGGNIVPAPPFTLLSSDSAAGTPPVAYLRTFQSWAGSPGPHRRGRDRAGTTAARPERGRPTLSRILQPTGRAQRACGQHDPVLRPHRRRA